MLLQALRTYKLHNETNKTFHLEIINTRIRERFQVERSEEDCEPQRMEGRGRGKAQGTDKKRLENFGNNH